MKKILFITIILLSLSLLLAGNPVQKQPGLKTVSQAEFRDELQSRTPPNWSFSVTPLDIMSSWFDYMVGSYNGLPLQLIPDANGGGYFMVFHAKSTSSATRKVYYAKVSAAGALEGTAAITTGTSIEGYPGLEVDAASGIPMYSWHGSVDTDSYSEIVLTWDKLTGGSLGTFSPVGIVIDNQIAYPAPYNTTDNSFYWPIIKIGPSPTTGMRRVYIAGRNNITHIGSTTYISENAYLAYADFDTAMLDAGTALNWSYTSVPDLDAWNHDATGTWRRPNWGFTVGDDGLIYLFGYHTAITVSTGDIIEEPELDVFACDNYGAGTWTRYTANGKVPSWNPPTDSGQGPGYFTGVADENLYWRITDSGHMNMVIDANGMLHFTGMFNLMNYTAGNDVPYVGLNTIKEVQFDTELHQFSINEVYPIAGTSADTLLWQPWDENGDHVVDAYNVTTGDPNYQTDWNYPYWSATVHNNAMGYQYNNFKMTEPTADGWVASVWQNCKRARAYNFDNVGQFQPFANVPEIYISLSNDFGDHWSEPIVINSLEVAQFAGNTPMYVYPADKIKDMGLINGHPTGRLALMFYHENTWGSYNVSPAVGANDGGTVKFMAIDIDMNSLVSSGISGTVRRADNQQPMMNATVTVGTESVTTDENGTYQFYLLPGLYNITATATGYTVVTNTNVEVVSGQTTTVDFALAPAVSVFGNVRSANPPAPLEGATVSLTGVSMYEAVTNDLGNFTVPGVVMNQVYLYVIQYEGYQMATGTIQVLNNNYSMGTIVLQPTANDDETAVIYDDKLLGASPNPFSRATHFSYSVKNPCPVELEIYNIRGQLVSRLSKPMNTKGLNSLEWDGKDSKGQALASGVYFCRMKIDKYTGIQKVLLRR